VSAVSSPSPRDVPYGPVGRSPWLDVDWRAHQRWVTVNDRPVNLIELGQGPPLLFVHGLSGSWPNWLEQLSVFAGRSPIGAHRVIALDLPGFGHSPLPAAHVSIPGYARTIDALMGALEVDAAAVVGNSMGGFVAAELAIAFPRRVERLVLVSPAGISTHGDPRGLRALRGRRPLERAIAGCGRLIASQADALTRRPGLRNASFGMIVPHPSRLPAPLVAEQIRGVGKPGFVEALRAIMDYDLRERLPEIVCPTLIVWGDRDRVVTVRDADLFQELIPDARKVIFEDTGHMAMLERPAVFNALLEEFLSE
jgi:pimeloyl-ACP methyl ester carboxylesterase